jgi:hypothetical protein
MTSAGRPTARLLWLGLWLIIFLVGLPAPLHAQATGTQLPGSGPAPQAESSGDPMFGYFAYGLLAGLIVFLVCKSARRASSGG